VLDDDDSKTEEPTGKRLGDIRGQGQVIRSADVGHAIMLSAAALVVLVLIPTMMSRVLQIARSFLEQSSSLTLDSPTVHLLLVDTLTQLGLTIALSTLLLMVAAMATGWLQFGFLFTFEALHFDLPQLSPLRGFQNMFSIRSVLDLGKNVLKLAVVGGVALVVLLPELAQVDNYISADISTLLHLLFLITLKLFAAVVGVLLVIAAADYFYQRFAFYKKNRMTKQEVKDEFKQMEGDPLVKGRLRQIRNEKARRRMMAAVPTATVIVTNPTHFACALKYDRTMPAPILVAKGLDLVAERIREVARKNFVPIVENPPLARTLFAAVDIDQEIPPEHYKAVAEVIGYVLRLRKRAAG
jgi:flagellar biosynthetic protein FlhB